MRKHRALMYGDRTKPYPAVSDKEFIQILEMGNFDLDEAVQFLDAFWRWNGVTWSSDRQDTYEVWGEYDEVGEEGELRMSGLKWRG